MTPAEYLASLPDPLSRRSSGTGKGDFVAGASVKDVVKRIREELTGAQKCGALPKGTKLSIRNRDYNVVDVDIVEWRHDGALYPTYTTWLMDCVIAEAKARGEGVQHPERSRSSWRGEDRFAGDYGRLRRAVATRATDALNDALMLIWQIADRHNYDNSDLMTDYHDVGYYLHVDANAVIATAEHGIRLECDPAFASLVARAVEASKRVGPKVTESVCGRLGVEHCGEWSLERLLKIDARAQGRPLVYDKRRRGWVVDSEARAERAERSAVERYHSELATR